MDEPTTSEESDKEKKEKQKKEIEVKTEPKDIKEEAKETHELSEPSASGDGQAKLLEKLQSEGILAPREVVSRPKEANKKRAVKMETVEGTEEGASKKAKRKRPSAETEDNKEEGAEGGEEKKKRKRERSHAASVVCEYIHTQGSELQCKQRAILGFHFCIRHILQDPAAPYQQCAHQRRPKNKNDTVTRCTNAIKKDSNETFCSTHLIMQGLKEVKKKQPSNTESTSGRSTPHDGGDVASPGQHTQTVTSPAINAVSSPIPAEFGEQPSVAPVVQIKKEPFPLGQQPLLLPVSSIKREDSHLLRALSAPFGPPQSGPIPSFGAMRPDHMLRTVLEQKPEPQKLDPQQAVPLNIAPSISSLAPVRAEPIQVQSAPPAVPPPQPPPQPPAPSISGPLPPQELLSRMTPAQKAIFDKFLRTRKQRPISPSPARPALVQRFIPQRIVGGRPRKLSKDHVTRVDRILRRISPQARQAWAMSVTNRTGLRMVAQRGPFPLTAVEKVNPVLANRLSHLARKRVPRVTIRSCHAFNNIRLPATAPPIRPRSPSSDEDETDFEGGARVIKLRSKRQLRKMVGPYRDIPAVSQMCDKLEDADFDDTDLFPLGLEPSDDELDDMPGSAGSAGMTHPTGMSLMGEYKDPHTELYLLRKQLRLERHQLLKTAQLNAPIMTSAKLFPLSTGAALRQRSEAMPVPPQMLITTLRRCCQVENKQRCDRACLPTANQCSLHVLYNVDQKLYQFCSHSFCRRPVLSVDAHLWDGKCRLHRESRLDKYGDYPVYDDMELPQARACSRRSSKSGESEDEDETDIDEDLDGHRDEFDDEDDVSVGSP